MRLTASNVNIVRGTARGCQGLVDGLMGMKPACLLCAWAGSSTGAWSVDMRMKVLFSVQNNCETLASVLCYPNFSPAVYTFKLATSLVNVHYGC